MDAKGGFYFKDHLPLLGEYLLFDHNSWIMSRSLLFGR